MKQKAFFIIFKKILVPKSCLRPESVLLRLSKVIAREYRGKKCFEKEIFVEIKGQSFETKGH